ncbi:IS110 family transposase [Paludicola sp. MB14-C6]|uniref:IS110 family transposase n=1 Tax=Paludihabitans sp. MB14-C6 TaxID=3070656 RepID=UPI0027DB45AC|nr:IS110 family transposase [Paludicola sp. MB14-C6]WMJ23145.1 IS110 family transposase [Paludicola sp. MB14-C6]
MISVGIDVSKGKSMICILKPYGEVLMSPYEINHIETSINDLITKIKSYNEEIRVIMEATGAYHLPLLTQFVEANIFVSVINPLVMKKYASAVIRKGKTDKLDSVRIANYGLDNWFKLEVYQPSETIYAELNMLGRQYSHYVKMRIESKLVLTNLLDRTMPGIKTLLSGKRSDLPTKDKLCDFVAKYWHYDNINKMSEKKFILSYSKWAKEKGYHQSESKAKAIYALSQNGIPTMLSNSPSTKMLVLEAIRVLQEINKTLEIILTQLQKISSDLPEYEVVRKMNGVGEVLAPRLIAEIGDVRRFHSGSALIAFAGIDAPPYESGMFVGTKRWISKRGSSLLRKTGYEVMKCLKTIKPTEDAAVYQYMLKKEAEGKAKKVAKIAALNKFLRIYYARVKEAYQN